MKKVLILMMMLMPLMVSATTVKPQGGTKQEAKQQKRQVVVLSCDIHCQGCCDKIMKNIAWEKGVKDIVCDLEQKTVTVTFDPRKTDVETLLKAFAKIDKPARVINE